ncbi:MAG: response regulator transcription factor [Nitrospirae bacterium]|jgi:DNA-binding NarL/FixJ family response regulator|nr:response regulator transcription factor [Nitrospirota bacterium]
MKIVIGCHSYLLSEGIKNLLKKEDDFEIIGIFDEGSDIEEILKLQPDLILVDNKIFRTLPESVLNNRTRFLLICDSSWTPESDRKIPELVLKGVYGLLAPDSNSQMLIEAMRIVHSGELWLDRNVVKNIITSISRIENRVILTKKEKEIVNLICHGYRNKEIAQKLDISEQTVKSHCNRIYKKMGVTDRLQLALYTHRIWSDQY